MRRTHIPKELHRRPKLHCVTNDIAVMEFVVAALTIQQAVEGHRRRPALAPLAIRIGISLGDVTWEGADCFGTPVIEAARLCAVAEGGQILAADLVRLTARGRGGHTFTPIGPVAPQGTALPDDGAGDDRLSSP